MRPWSHSRLSTYEECPKQYQYSYVENLPGFRPTSPAATRGSAIHAQAESYLLGKLIMYPPELQKVASHAMMLKAKKATAEQKLAITDKWEPCDYKSKDAYFRGVVDVSYVDGDTVHVEDWKTGQTYASHPVQMETYVAILSAYHPTAVKFISRLIYIDQGVVSVPKVTLAERIKPIRMMLDGRINIAETDGIFPVRSGTHCRFCDYSQRFGGPCPH